MTARGRLLGKLANGSLPPWAIKVLIGGAFLLVTWGTWITASTFNTNNSRFTDAEGTALQRQVDVNHTDIAVHDARLRAIENDIAEIKASQLRTEALLREQ